MEFLSLGGDRQQSKETMKRMYIMIYGLISTGLMWTLVGWEGLSGDLGFLRPKWPEEPEIQRNSLGKERANFKHKP